MNKPRLLILSHVFPFPGNSGQRQRVFYMLKCAKENFHVTFLSLSPGGPPNFEAELQSVCDEVILLAPAYNTVPQKVVHKLKGTVYCWKTGLKFSNYIIGEQEFSERRIFEILAKRKFDVVLWEYWHAAELAPAFKSAGAHCVLDMHDILWRSYERQTSLLSPLLKWIMTWRVGKYKIAEEKSWKYFDRIIAINEEEEVYVRKILKDHVQINYVPMGIDLARWPYEWCSQRPHRLAYYGGLSSPHNTREALRCYHEIMPQIWGRFCDAEFWIVGANPPEEILKLSTDSRVRITGYVEDVGRILKTMGVLMCPWTGTYGFRSRLVEAMAVGVPVVATPDAVYGMAFQHGKEIFLGADSRMLAKGALELLGDPAVAARQSQTAREKVENSYGLLPYQKFFTELREEFFRVS